jgi:hypothetical protein
VDGFHILHKWSGGHGGVAYQEMEFQEMDVDGQGITEAGGSNDDKIFVIIRGTHDDKNNYFLFSIRLVNVEQVFSRVGQLLEANLAPDTLTDMVSIMVNKLVYKPSVKDIKQKRLSHGPDNPEHSDQESDSDG